MRRAVLAVRDDTVMLVSRETVVVLRVLVVVVDVGVQQGQCARRGDQRRNEQQRQRAVHNDECMGRGQPRSKGQANRPQGAGLTICFASRAMSACADRPQG
jgi:hypothetical protein